MAGMTMRRDSPWLALILLTAISTVGFIDRIVMNVLAVPIQAEFALSDTQVGLLTGLAFAVLNVMLGVVVARYAERAGSLSWPFLSGYLRGFIDAVFCDGERYFVIDYKSNHLGARQSDYRPARILESMIQHDYVLQYLVYTVAVDRLLASRIADYEYERHFGGAY